MTMRVVLASASEYRADQLRRLRIDFETIPSDIDEDAFKAQISQPQQLAETLARAKAASVARAETDAVVIGSDQVAVVDGLILSKPHSEARARDQLQTLQGRTHILFTAMSVQCGERSVEHCDVTRLTMRSLGEDAIARYVAAESPTKSVGAYLFESLGVALFDRIDTEDPTAIVGLPLLALVRALEGFEVHVP
ncbi:MAG: nucleoside triphosphate pyrophosphatase [Myxococcota bacterium]